MAAPRIALIHAQPIVIEPIASAFRELWPQARVTGLLDDSLAPDLAATGSITPALVERCVTLARYSETCGADALLFTCAGFETALDEAKRSVRIPVLKPNEAMLDEALATGNRIALLGTLESRITLLRTELEQLAAGRHALLQIETRAIPDALNALRQGRVLEHDRLIAATADEIDACDALLFAQFSMARAAAGVAARSGRRVLTSPGSAVARLKQIFAS
jgi:hypothetical protein